jgi:alkaline phosphatase D
MAGHVYAVVTTGPDAIDTEFVRIVRPITRATTPDGGALRYRVSHQACLWQPGTPPKLEQRVLEADAKLSV